MRRRSLVVLMVSVLFAGAGVSCRRRAAQSTIRMADMHAKKQLISGFYNLEAGAWRWTRKECSVQLAVPRGAAESGAVLKFQGSAPAEALASTGSITMSSSVSGVSLPPQTITKPGEFVYQADVPASAVQALTVTAEFRLDHTFRAPNDERELGVISSVISLQSK